MSAVNFPNDPNGVFLYVPFPDFEPTWAGPNPCGPGFCLGSEDGRLRFTDESLQVVGTMDGVSAANEAVNGVAHSENWTAVTTRADINLIGPRSSKDVPHPTVVIERGAFGVARAPSGHFVVPLGRFGIMDIKPGTGPDDPVMIAGTEAAGLNVCRVLPLAGEDGHDLIVCAGRRGGVGVMSFREDLKTPRLNTLRYDDLDVVDVCALDAVQHPRAVAAVARDGTVILFRDMLHHNTPKTIKFRSVQGTVYRILSAHGDLFLLTSKGLFVLANFTTQLIQGGWTGTRTTDVLLLPIGAADANVVGDQWLVAVGVSEIFRFDLAKLPATKAGAQCSTPEEIPIHSEWQHAHVEHERESVAPAS